MKRVLTTAVLLYRVLRKVSEILALIYAIKGMIRRIVPKRKMAIAQ